MMHIRYAHVRTGMGVSFFFSCLPLFFGTGLATTIIIRSFCFFFFTLSFRQVGRLVAGDCHLMARLSCFYIYLDDGSQE